MRRGTSRPRHLREEPRPPGTKHWDFSRPLPEGYWESERRRLEAAQSWRDEKDGYLLFAAVVAVVCAVVGGVLWLLGIIPLGAS